MSLYSNVTEQDLIILRKLAEQQKNQRARKIKYIILKETHDIKLAESLSPITKRLDEVKESTQKVGDVIKNSQQETPQLAIENTPSNQPIENTRTLQPTENNEGVIYDVELENTLIKMKDTTVFFNIEETNNGDNFWNGFPVEKVGGNKIKINENVFNITTGIQKVLTETSNIPLKKLNNQDREILINILESLDFDNYKSIRGESKSGRYKQPKNIFKN